MAIKTRGLTATKKSYTRHYLMISRSLGSKKKGDVFVEYNDQAQVAIGGVSTYELRDNSLTLEIPTEAAHALGIPETRRIVVDFDLPSVSISKLRCSLKAIFARSQEEI